MRLIDAEELTELLHWAFDKPPFSRKTVQKMIDLARTIDAVPVRHGRWIGKSTGGEPFDCCSECGYVEWDAPNKYCPNCVARMDAERSEE